MGKKAKDHRKKVQKRNKNLEQSRISFRNKFQEELLKQIEKEKEKMAEKTAETPKTEENQ